MGVVKPAGLRGLIGLEEEDKDVGNETVDVTALFFPSGGGMGRGGGGKLSAICGVRYG